MSDYGSGKDNGLEDDDPWGQAARADSHASEETPANASFAEDVSDGVVDAEATEVAPKKRSIVPKLVFGSIFLLVVGIAGSGMYNLYRKIVPAPEVAQTEDRREEIVETRPASAPGSPALPGMSQPGGEASTIGASPAAPMSSVDPSALAAPGATKVPAAPVATPPAVAAPVATPPAVAAPVATPPAVAAPVATPPAVAAPVAAAPPPAAAPAPPVVAVAAPAPAPAPTPAAPPSAKPQDVRSTQAPAPAPKTESAAAKREAARAERQQRRQEAAAALKQEREARAAAAASAAAERRAQRPARQVVAARTAPRSNRVAPSRRAAAGAPAIEQAGSATLTGYRIESIEPRYGEHQNAWIRMRDGRLRVVSAGDSIDGSRVVQIDGASYRVQTTQGVIR